MKQLTPALRALLLDIDARDGPGLGVSVDPSAARQKAQSLGLISGRRMKVGHRFIYMLTAAGQTAIK